MVKLDNYKTITYQNKDYAIVNLLYKDINVPIIIDSNIHKHINEFNKPWSINDKGMVTTTHTIDGNIIEIYMHDLVMKLNNNKNNKPIIHINRLGIDNRYENLMYDTFDKDINKNLKKKQRIITLPKTSGINPDHLPTYVWYLNNDGSHGDRFIIEVGDVTWKTTSSNSVSLRYKLEEAKKYLRYLRQTRKDLFDDFSMNGDYNKEGLKMLDSFYAIIKQAGYELKSIQTNRTQLYLKENREGLTEFEKYLLDKFIPDQNRPIINDEIDTFIDNMEHNLPKGCKYDIGDDIRGDSIYFGRWRSSNSRNIKFIDKLKELKEYLKSIQ